MPSLWPAEFGKSSVNPPLAILREQANALPKITHGVIEGRISSSASSGGFRHQFYLVVPTLDDYAYELFYVHHPITLYPASLSAQSGPGIVECKDESTFVTLLEKVLTSEHTKKIIAALLAQAEAVAK